MKVLIIGLGSIGRKHAAALKKIDTSVEIFALRSSEHFEEVKGIQSITSKNQIPKNIDFIIISNPTSEHFETIKQFSKLRKPLFIEKPLFHQLKKINFPIPTINYVACNLRFHPCIDWLKKNLQLLGKINEVNIYCGSYLPDWRPNVDFRNIYSAHHQMGGGVHLDLIHELDYCYYFFGKPKSKNVLLKKNSSLKINAIDYANYQLDYTDFATNITLNYFRKDVKRQIELVCQNDTFTIDLVKNKITKFNQTIEHFEVEPLDTYIEQMKYFIHCVKTKTKPFNSIKEATEVLNICLK
jgi:predicted dehydrogenase